MKKGIHTPTKIKGKKAYGFRARMKCKTGRKLLNRRRAIGRKKLSV